MTREESIMYLKKADVSVGCEVKTKTAEAIEMAIKALEQQPTDAVDRVTIKEYLESFGKVKTELSGVAVDRQAVLDVISELNAISFYEAQEDSKECYYEIRNAIKQLLPVTPQPKMGKWFIDERPESDREVVCSNCDQPIFKYHKLDFDYRPKYCPNCGAKMYEIPTSSEGSDKE